MKRGFFVILTVFLLTNLLIRGPDLIRYLTTPANKWYTGQVSWFDPWDHNVYFSAIGWGRRDGLLYANLYDTTSNKPLFIYTLYTLIGKIFSWSNYSNAFIFHLTGLIFSFILLTVIWWFVGLFIKEFWPKTFSFLLISVGGGLGWLLFPQMQTPDISQPGFTLESALRRPHESISLSLFFLSVGNFLKWEKTNKNKYIFLSFVSTFIMLLFHPYSLLTFGVILSIFVFYKFVKYKKTSSFLGLLIIMSSGVIWFLIIGKTLIGNPGFSGLLSQVQSSPNPLMVILGWGFLFPLILVGLFSRSSSDDILFLKIWFIFGWLIIYLPFGFQRLLIRGLFIPVALLAGVGLKKITKQSNHRFFTLSGLILIIVSMSLIYTSAKRLTESENNRWIYLNKGEAEAINYLNRHGQNEEGVMAGYQIANILPAVTKKRVWAGHSFQSPQFTARIKMVNRFYSANMREKEAKTFLKKANSVWVFFGPAERAINNINSLNYSFLKPVLRNRDVTLYKNISSL